MDILRAEIHYFIESHVATTPSVIHPVVQISYLYSPKYFSFFMKTDEEVPLVRDIRRHMRDLQINDMPYNEAFKNARHNSMKSTVVER